MEIIARQATLAFVFETKLLVYNDVYEGDYDLRMCYQGCSTADHKADSNNTSGGMIQRERVVEHCKYIIIVDNDGDNDEEYVW